MHRRKNASSPHHGLLQLVGVREELFGGHLLEEDETVGGSQHGIGILVEEGFPEQQLNSLELLDPDALRSGAGEFIAKWLLSRKWIQGKPVLFCSMLLFVGWLCGPFMGTAGLILLYNILDYVDDTLGIEHSDSFSMMIRLGCQTMCMLGMALKE